MNSTKQHTAKKDDLRRHEIQQLKHRETELAARLGTADSEDQDHSVHKQDSEKLLLQSKGLQAANTELGRKLKETAEQDPSAAGRLRAFDELQYWRKRYDMLEEERKKGAESELAVNSNGKDNGLEKELERLRKSSRKYKSAYLKLKKSRERDYLGTMRTVDAGGNRELAELRQTRSTHEDLSASPSPARSEGISRAEREIRQLGRQVARKADPIHII